MFAIKPLEFEEFGLAEAASSLAGEYIIADAYDYEGRWVWGFMTSIIVDDENPDLTGGMLDEIMEYTDSRQDAINACNNHNRNIIKEALIPINMFD